MRGVGSFLLQNSDMLGFCYVEAVILSTDLRSAKILIVSDKTKPEHDILNVIEHDKPHIAEELKKVFSSKYLPKLSFIIS